MLKQARTMNDETPLFTKLTRVIEVLLIAFLVCRWGEVIWNSKLSYIGNGICFRGYSLLKVHYYYFL